MNLRDLYQIGYENRSRIYKITGAFVILGLIVAILSSVEYRSDALLLPEVDDNQSQARNLLQNFGGILGMGGELTSPSQEGTIPPAVYPKIINSLSFQDRLLSQQFYFTGPDTTVTGYEYFQEIHFSFGKGIWEYSVGLPGKISEAFSSGAQHSNLPPSIRNQLNEQAIHLTKAQLEVVEEMRDRISFSIDSETGVMNVSALMPNPTVAAQVCEKLVSMLKEYVTDYSTQKAKEKLEFAQSQHQQAQQRFEEAQNKLAEFQDQNVNLQSQKALTQEERLQAEYDLAYSLYNNVSQRLMEARMRVQDQTPVFKVLQAANVPVEKSQPRRVLILVVALVAGLVVSFLYVGGKYMYQNFNERT